MKQVKILSINSIFVTVTMWAALSAAFLGQRLEGQITLASSGTTASSTTYLFSSAGSVTLSSIVTESSANLGGGSNALDFANGTSLSINQGTFINSGTTTFANGSNPVTGLQFQYTLQTDKGDTGSVVAVFDTNQSNSINSGDKGFAFNLTSDNQGTITTLTQAFSIAVTGSGTSAYAPSTLAFTSTSWPAATGTSGYNYQQSIQTFPASGAATVFSFAFLVSDVDSALIGRTSLVTFFTTSGTLAAGSAVAFGAGSGGAVQDWYGTGTTTTNVFSTSDGSAVAMYIPEPAGWATSGALLGTGVLAWWRRRRVAANPALAKRSA